MSYSQLDYNQTDWGVHPMDYSRVGTAGWQFLKLPTNARSLAMGGVSTAVGFGNANSAFTNPASAADIVNYDAQFSLVKWVADTKLSSVSVAKNIGEWGCVGLNYVYLDYGTMARTEIGSLNGQPGIIAVTQGLGTFTAHDLAIGLMYSRKITQQLQLGGNVRYLEEQLDDAKTHTWSVDIGTIYWTGLKSLRLSMLGKNFGPDAEYTEYDSRIQRVPVRVRLPMMFMFGLAYDIVEPSQVQPHRLTIAAEYVKPNDGMEKINIGTEFFFNQMIYLRGGYRFNYDEEELTLGFGAEYSVEEDITLKADYAYEHIGRFGYVNMLTVGIGF